MSSTYTESTSGSPTPTVCPAPQASYTATELAAPFMWPGNKPGVATASLTPDPTTNRPTAAAVATYVNGLIGSGTLPSLPTSPVSNPTGSGSTPESAMQAFVAQDAATRTNLKNEYCHYEARYRYALKEFLQKATSGVAANNAEALTLLATTKTLNLHLNSVLEVMNYLAQQRVQRTNALKDSVETSNAAINTRLAEMQRNYALLNSDDAIVRTQREMVRYTEEKNAFNANQISLWAAANVVALAVIFYVYRS
jgi:hypothetical protein